MKVIHRVCFGRMFGERVFKIVFLSVNSGVFFQQPCSDGFGLFFVDIGEI